MAQIVLLVCAALLTVVTALPTRRQSNLAKKQVNPEQKTLPQDGCDLGMVRCQSGGIYEIDSGQLICIPAIWQCDNWNDCGDASDEDRTLCAPNACDQNSWQCPETNLCIPRYWLCNTWDDCGDGADEHCNGSSIISVDSSVELDDASSVSGSGSGSGDYWEYYAICYEMGGAEETKSKRRNSTKDHQSKFWYYPEPCDYNGRLTGSEYNFACGDGTCILESLYCDGNVDCLNATDEPVDDPVNCPLRHCTDWCEYRCSNTNLCSYWFWTCDDVDDCADGSEEVNCDYKQQVKSQGSQQQIKGTLGAMDHKPHIG